MKQFIKHPSVKSITVYRENDGRGHLAFQVNDYDALTLTAGLASLADYVEFLASNPSGRGQVPLSKNKSILKPLKVLTINFK